MVGGQAGGNSRSHPATQERHSAWAAAPGEGTCPAFVRDSAAARYRGTFPSHVIGIDFDLETGKPVFARGSAGYSGPAILPIALQKVWECAKAVSIPIVGIGGISSIDDARKFFLAGATAIQVGTALYADPGLPERIIDALEKNPEWVTARALPRPASSATTRS